ncbi:hypothetical protein JCM18900_1851 [Psychrobacter sp. JCM 18900]|nr:hypothetical protein JCM18900_1851 [Psychrobacter sp. JCM 18900]
MPGLRFAGDTGGVITRNHGEKLNVKGGATTALSNNNIGVVADDMSNTLIVKLAKNLTGLDSVTFNNGVVISSTGINVGNNKITNVANGAVMAGSKDAVNGSQLHSLASTVAANKTKYYSVNSSVTGVLSNENNDGATGYNAMAMGGNASASGSQTIAIGSGESGQHTTASGEQSIAIGANVVSKGSSSIAIGGDDLNAASEANIDGTANVGQNSGSVNTVFRSYTGRDLVEPTQYARNTEAAGAASIAIGSKALSTGDLSTAIGIQSSTAGIAASAFGIGASASKDGSVSLGAGSTTETNATSETTIMIGGVLYNIAGNVKDDSGTLREGAQVSVGTVGAERQIKHVAGGAVNKNSTDAINGSQLHATNQSIENLSESKITFASDRGAPVERKLGETLNIKGGAIATAALTTGNIGVESDASTNTLTVKLAENVDLGTNGSVKMGSSSSIPYSLGPVTTVNSLGVLTGNWLGSTAVTGAGIIVNGPLGIPSTALTMDGLTIIGGPSITRSHGIDAGSKKITNVKAGSTEFDAVNYGQLEETNTAVSRGLDFIGDNTDTTSVITRKSGEVLKISGGHTILTDLSDDNIGVIADNNTNALTVKLAKNLTGLNSASFGNDVIISSTGLRAGATVINTSGVSFSNSTVGLSSGGLNNGGKTITGVADGTLDDEAVNYGQLKAVKESAENANRGWDISAQGDSETESTVEPGDKVDFNSKNGNITVSKAATSNDISFELNNNLDLGVSGSIKIGDTTVSENGLTIVDGPSITKSGIDAADTKITNVQDGEVSATSQDAINGGQLYVQGTGISSIIGGDTVYNAESGTFTNSDIGGTGQGNIDGAIASIRQGTIEINENVQINTTAIATNVTNIANNTSNIMTNTTNIKTNTDRLDAGLNFGADSGANINKPIGDDSVLSFTGGNNITTTAEGSSIKFDLNDEISVNSVKVGTTVISSSGISMQDGPSMTSQGLFAGNQRMVGVADGVEATDAVNYSQLSALDSRLNNNMSDLGYKIDEVEDDANAGISAAMAMSAMPQAYIAGKSLIGGGVGTYNGESAVAIGFSKLSNDGRWVIKVNGSADTQGNVGGAVGAGFHFD